MPTSPLLSAPRSLLSLCWQGRYPDLRRVGWITTIDPTFFVQPVLFPSPTLAGMVFWPMSCKEKSSVVSLGPGLLERKPLAIAVVHTPRSFSVLLAMVVEKYDANMRNMTLWQLSGNNGTKPKSIMETSAQ